MDEWRDQTERESRSGSSKGGVCARDAGVVIMLSPSLEACSSD